MEITLPPHVSAAWETPEQAAEWLQAQAVEYARGQAVAVAAEAAAAIIREASAPFDGTEAPTSATVSERVSDLESGVAVLASEILGGAA